MNWNKFDREIRSLAKKIDYAPDIVVGIARGGVVPAVILAKQLQVKDMFVLKLEREGERRISAYTISDVSKKKILLVEDMLETGQGLKAGKKFLEEKGAEVKTACLYTMPISEIEPDYSLKEIAEVIPFPWE
jgi:hypoxanthine phosphoribosyltransferase